MLRLLDLFCGPGTGARGYMRAGWDVTGFDLEARHARHYPGRFIFGSWEEGLALAHFGFDAIHASPPCQHYSSMTNVSGDPLAHPDLVAEVREGLVATGLPWVIENVVGAPLLSPTLICGTSLGCTTLDGQYRLARHRNFETSFDLRAPACSCKLDARPVLGVYGGGGHGVRLTRSGSGGSTGKANSAQAQEMFGCALPKTALNLGFPPAYTELVGYQLANHVLGAVV